MVSVLVMGLMGLLAARARADLAVPEPDRVGRLDPAVRPLDPMAAELVAIGLRVERSEHVVLAALALAVLLFGHRRPPRSVSIVGLRPIFGRRARPDLVVTKPDRVGHDEAASL